MPRKPSFLLQTIVTITAALLVLSVAVFAWTEPGQAPPGGNVAAPINVGSVTQDKAGWFTFQGGGTRQDTFLATTSGNVGIGTTSPGAKLHISGSGWVSAKIESSTSGAVLSLTNQDRTYSLQTRENRFDIRDTSPGLDVARMSISSTGNVGIGITNPGAQLQLGDIYSPGGKNLLIGNDVFLSDIDIQHTLGIYSNTDSTRASIKLGSGGGIISGYNGKIGINAPAPTQALDVNGFVKGWAGLCIADDCRTSWPGGGVGGSGTDNYIPRWNGTNALENSVIYQTDEGNVGIGTTALTIKLAIGDTDTGLNWAGDGQLDLYSNNVNTLSVRNGNVGIGTTSPRAKLDVGGEIRGRLGCVSTYEKECNNCFASCDAGDYVQAVHNNGDHIKIRCCRPY